VLSLLYDGEIKMCTLTSLSCLPDKLRAGAAYVNIGRQ